MVVKMMRWRPWPPLVTKKYEVRLVVRRLEGCDLVREGAAGGMELGKLTVEIRWKGPKMALSSLRRPAVKRNFTREVDASLVQNGVVDWDEEFQSHCSFSAYKDNVFHPWEIAFTVFNGLNQGPKNKIPIIGTALVNLAEFVSAAEQKELELNIPLTPCAGSADPCPTLCLSLSLLELRTAQETAEPVERSVVPASSPPQSVEAVSTEKDELSALKAGLRKVKIFTGYVSSRKAKKACREGEGSDGRCSAKSDGEYNYPFDSDSLDDFEEGESDEGKEDATVRKSFSYGTLAYANYAGGSFYSDARINTEDEDLVYYSNRKSDVGCSHAEDSATSVSEPPLLQSSKRGLLSWRKRKLSFRSPKAKGEPLLKKAYGEEGGDDIDFDRRQLSSDESLPHGRHKTEEDSSANRSSVSEFGDDSFAIGSWEHKEVTSRDGHMKLQTEVFFASIDQRSERAAGESACTALVAVIADWFQNNQELMPIKSQFDSLIREGSLEWRNLCENETYKEHFPDKHFDLETVLQAKIRPLSVVSQKSFIGFFHPEGIMDEGRFDFLHGAMSFDNIWDEISRAGSECLSSGEPQVYIVCWNDHFFLLKVEPEAYYIVDTLGERLYEGCNQAYILKFDSNTVIHKMSNAAQGSDDKAAGDQQIVAAAVEAKSQPENPKEESLVGEALVTKPEESMKEEEVFCKGKESCKEYIKSFLAAIPLRELQADMKKGLMASTPLHQRLQIELNYTQSVQSLLDIPAAIAPQADVSIVEFATCT
ncbi:EEIG1/EHBP1 N-terminal domain containing protein [Parasponia andersonii]|uniref:EEIG1/EHBP1 N-terminal domain containing protein n=1 Tax=Parasponia andersonii TaxID=3476 RepID=A0A2P5B017_PARAD|nr:EEIG1/EHBP1 N-terminal domain containing protein [Parasponia andersonii]